MTTLTLRSMDGRAVAPTLELSGHTALVTILASAGSLLHAWAYDSLRPILAAGIYYAVGIALLGLIRANGRERKMFRTTFSVCWCTAGIAAIYATILGDVGQLTSDAGNFYALAAGLARDLNVSQLSTISEGAGAIVLWKAIYDLFELLGFGKDRYIGILVNVIAVSLTGVFTLKAARRCFPESPARLSRLAAAFPLTGIFWLFASIHLRDAVTLLGVTLLIYFWTRFLTRPGAADFALLVAASVAGIVYFGLLRTEFAYVPFALLAAGIAAGMGFSESKGPKVILLYAGIFVGAAAAVVLFITLKSEMFTQLQRAYESYLETSLETNASDSLGNKLIVTAPLPVRLIFGSLYLFVFPIPFWSGFQLESAAHVFKSCNVLFFYWATPLFWLSLRRLAANKVQRTLPVMFLLIVFAGFTFSVALTSLETRHFGNFLAPFLILLLVPDPEDPRDGREFRQWLLALLATMGSVHLAWVGIKLL